MISLELFYKGYRNCQKLSDVLKFTSNKARMQQVYNKDYAMYRSFFSKILGNGPFLIYIRDYMYQ